MNRQFSVFSLYNFTRNNPQIIYTLDAQKTSSSAMAERPRDACSIAPVQ